jgi:hypothetical protein
MLTAIKIGEVDRADITAGCLLHFSHDDFKDLFQVSGAIDLLNDTMKGLKHNGIPCPYS